MTGEKHAFDTAAPVNAGFLLDEFGIVFPSDSGFNIRTQTGGVTCKQLSFSGVFLPLGRPKLNRGFPDWLPDTTEGVPHGEKHPVVTIELDSIPDTDYESLPEWVRERGHFYNWDEFSYWLDEHAWWYSWADLIEELRRWNYDPAGDMPHARDMTRVWDSLDDIWNAIDETLPFTYEEYEYNRERLHALQNDEPFNPPLPDDYPGTCEGIKWVTITGSKQDSNGDVRCEWAEELTGETVLLSYPNSD